MNLSFFTFFKNKELGQFFLSIFIMTFGESLINIFVPIYLFNSGFPIYQILFFYFLGAFYFLIWSYPIAWLVSKIGSKHAILCSSFLLVAYFLGLIFIQNVPILFFILPALLSLRSSLFNYGYDTIFWTNSAEDKIGKTLAALGILTLLATAVAPFLGGLLFNFNFSWAFSISSFLILSGTIPLFFSRDISPHINFNSRHLLKRFFSRLERGNVISFSGYAIESTIGRVIWPIFIILVVGSISKTGFVISLSLLISILVFSFVGNITDKVKKVFLVKVGTLLYMLGWVARIFADSTVKILAIDSYKNVTEKLLQLPWGAQTYTLAKRGDYFEFIVFRQIAFNFVRIVVIPLLMIVFWFDFYPFIISFLIASIFSLGYMFIKQ